MRPRHPRQGGDSLTRVWIALALLLGLGLAGLAEAGALKGQVVGMVDNPRPYVRVELYGAENRTTFTDAQGRFAVTLPGGRYAIHVIDGGRRMEFTAEVPANDERAATFKLPW